MRMRAAWMVLSIGSAAGVAGADVVFSDADFNPANWGFETVMLGPGGTSAASQVAGGNPGTARRVRNDVNAGGTIYGFSRYGTTTGTRYDPATQGEIASLDFSIDFRFIDGAGGDGHAIMLGAKQGTFVYAAAMSITGSSGAWGTWSATGLTAADFVSLNGGPVIDLTPTGGFIRFGFIAGNSAPGDAYFNRVDYDNFLVRVRQVPSPGPAALLCIGLGAMRRRR